MVLLWTKKSKFTYRCMWYCCKSGLCSKYFRGPFQLLGSVNLHVWGHTVDVVPREKPHCRGLSASSDNCLCGKSWEEEPLWMRSFLEEKKHSELLKRWQKSWLACVTVQDSPLVNLMWLDFVQLSQILYQALRSAFSEEHSLCKNC